MSVLRFNVQTLRMALTSQFVQMWQNVESLQHFRDLELVLKRSQCDHRKSDKGVQYRRTEEHRLLDNDDPRIKLIIAKPFKCDKCEDRFKTKNQLRDHKQEIHSY